MRSESESAGGAGCAFKLPLPLPPPPVTVAGRAIMIFRCESRHSSTCHWQCVQVAVNVKVAGGPAGTWQGLADRYKPPQASTAASQLLTASGRLAAP